MSKYLCYIFLAFSFQVFSQKVNIKGFIYNSKKTPLEGAIVLIRNSSTKSILQYTVTNDKGFFDIFIDIEKSSFIIEITHINYQKLTQSISELDRILEFTLQESVNNLKEIIIKSPLLKRRDTLKYLLSKYSKDQNLSLSKVLSRIPGIEVLENGQIQYYGKPIQKYYIEGLDLLEGKYNLANKGLAVKDVEEVQVLENHQPIRILDTIKFSDLASLNIKLKNKDILIGNSEIGLGYKPFLKFMKTLPMYFSKKHQFIGTLINNNVGIDSRKELKVLTLDNFEDYKRESTTNWVSLAPTGFPNLPQKYWLDNSTTVTSLNFLTKLNSKSNLSIKILPTFIDNKQNLNVVRKTKFFGLNNTVNLSEVTENEFLTKEVSTKIVLVQNNKNSYLKNTLDFSLEKTSEYGGINNQSFTQNISRPKEYIKNKFKTFFPVNKTIYTFSSNFFLSKNSNSLVVSPGLFSDLLNNGESYEKINQKVNNSNLFIEKSLGFIKRFKGITFENEISIIFDKQNLNSEIYVNDNNISNNSEFLNDILLTDHTIKYVSKIQYNYKGYRIDAELPIRYSSINLMNNSLNIVNNLQRAFFEPKVYVTKEFGDFFELSLNVSQRYSFGRLNRFFNGYILENYRRLLSFNPIIPVNKSIKGGIYLQYKDFNNGFFIETSFNNSNIKRNIAYEYNFKDNGVLEVNSIIQNLTSSNNSFSFQLRKNIDILNISIRLSGNLSTEITPSILNSNNVSNKTTNENFTLRFEYDLYDKLTTFLKSELVNDKTRLNNINAQAQSSLNNSFGFNYTLNTYNAISITYNNFNIKRPELFINNLLNINYKKTLKNEKSYLEFSLNNVLNNKVYLQVYSNEFSQSISEYKLRPLQILLKYKFYF